MKKSELRQIIREEIQNALHESGDKDIERLPAEAPNDIIPEEIAKYIQPAITLNSTGNDIFNLIGYALTRYFSNDPHYKGKVKTIIWNYLYSERHEDYVSDVMDALLKLGVEWKRK